MLTFLIVLITLLLLRTRFLNQRHVDNVLASTLEPASDFLLKWIGVMFTPAFVQLPNVSIEGVQIAIIAGFFFISYAALFVLHWAMIVFAIWVSPFNKHEQEVPLKPIESTRDVPVTDPTDRGTTESEATVVTMPEIEKQESDTQPDAIDLAAESLTRYIPMLFYALLFVIGLPIYCATGFSLAFFLSFNVLSFQLAIAFIPPKWKKIFHPIIVSAAVTLLLVYVFGLIRGWDLHKSVSHYANGTEYIQLWTPGMAKSVPGAGDVLSSLLEGSVVAFAVPMVRFRKTLWAHIIEISIPLFLTAALTVFGYPWIAKLVYVRPEGAYALSAKHITGALAIPYVQAFDGDVQLTVTLCIFTGILAALTAPWTLKVIFRVKEQDKIMSGIMMGTMGSAIGTSELIQQGKLESAAISTVAVTLYGLICVILAAIPPVDNVVKMLAGA